MAHMVKDPTMDNMSDGYHTFGELYDHRRALTAVLARFINNYGGTAWRSKEHHPDDDPMFEGGYFIVGFTSPKGQVSYHYKLSHWDDFSRIPELPHAPKWDGHTLQDTVERLLEWARG